MKNEIFMINEINSRVKSVGNFSEIASKIKIKKEFKKNNDKITNFLFMKKITISFVTLFLIVFSFYYLSHDFQSTTTINSGNISIDTYGDIGISTTSPDNPPNWDVIYETKVDDNSFNLPLWNERTINQKFNQFIYNNETYCIWSFNSSSISEQYIENKLDSINISSYDENMNEYSIIAEVFEIKKINSSCAVALKFENDENYYSYINGNNKFKTLFELVDDLNLKEYASFGRTEYRYENGAEKIVRFDDFDDSIIWDTIFNNLDLENELISSNNKYVSISMIIEITVPILGIDERNESLPNGSILCISDDGYIKLKVHTSKYSLFYVGEENTKKLCDYIINCVNGYEVIFVTDQDC